MGLSDDAAGVEANHREDETRSEVRTKREGHIFQSHRVTELVCDFAVQRPAAGCRRAECQGVPGLAF